MVTISTPKGTWVDISDKKSSSLPWHKFAYVSPEEKVLAYITNYGDGPVWYVWRNGAGYGEYMTKEAAMTQAEKVA